MTNKTIRFVTAFDGHSADEVVTMLDTTADAMIADGFAVADLDGPDGSDELLLTEHAAAHAAMGVEAPGSVAALLATAGVAYADDAAAAIGLVPVGGLYNVAGVVHVRVA